MQARLRIRLVILVVLIVLFFWMRNRRLERVEQPPTRTESAAASLPASASPSVVFAPMKSNLHLESPQAALATQIGLMQTNDYDGFRKTFLIDVTRAQFDSCRLRMKDVKISPDWEMAKEEQRDGHRVVRVSIWGKSYTDFHFIGEKVLTGQLWCLPPQP